jgi:hypothetical protein
MKAEIKISLAIPVLFLIGLLLTRFGLNWNYNYASFIATVLLWGTIYWAVIHIVVLLTKPQLKQKLIWLCLTSIPVLYLCFMLISGKD